MEKIMLEKVFGDTREEYLKKMSKQFLDSMGSGAKEVGLESLDFEDWLKERYGILDGYKGLLDYMGVEYNNAMTIEIGKGFYDSIGCKAYKTTIITPYTYGIKKRNNNNDGIIKANLIVSDDKEELNGILFKDSNLKFDSFMTHNPYSLTDIDNLKKLANDYSVIYGVYGKNYDKDREMKLTQLRRLREQLESKSNLQEQYIKFGDNYCMALVANNKRGLSGVRYRGR